MNQVKNIWNNGDDHLHVLASGCGRGFRWLQTTVMCGNGHRRMRTRAGIARK